MDKTIETSYIEAERARVTAGDLAHGLRKKWHEALTTGDVVRWSKRPDDPAAIVTVDGDNLSLASRDQTVRADKFEISPWTPEDAASYQQRLRWDAVIRGVREAKRNPELLEKIEDALGIERSLSPKEPT